MGKNTQAHDLLVKQVSRVSGGEEILEIIEQADRTIENGNELTGIFFGEECQVHAGFEDESEVPVEWGYYDNIEDVEQYLPLTEEEYEKATPELQIRNDLELGYFRDVKKRDDVNLLFRMKAGRTKRHGRDTRQVLDVYEAPGGFIYRVNDEAKAFAEYSTVGVPVSVIVNDAYNHIEHAVETDHKLEEAYSVETYSDKISIKDLEHDIHAEVLNAFGEEDEE